MNIRKIIVVCAIFLLFPLFAFSGTTKNILTNKADLVDGVIPSSQLPAGLGGVTIEQVKADTDIADTLSKRHSNTTDHAAGSDNQDLSGKVDKITGHSLVADTEISKIHASGSDNQDLSSYVQTSDSRLSDARTPTTHGHAQSEVAGLETVLTGKEPANSNIQAHVIAAHAPSNAQKNSDITKAEIEAKLTGELTSHTHAGGAGGLGYTLHVQALTSSPADGATVYFGQQPRAPGAVNLSRVYIRKAGTIKMANILCQSGTAGTNQAWSLYIRKNNTEDTLIATLSLATAERVFQNSALNIAVAAGDYVEIKSVQPTWATNPLTTIYGGYLYIE